MMQAAHALVRPLFLLWPASRFQVSSPLMTLAVLPAELLGVPARSGAAVGTREDPALVESPPLAYR